jgi:hypothetical protein
MYDNIQLECVEPFIQYPSQSVELNTSVRNRNIDASKLEKFIANNLDHISKIQAMTSNGQVFF